MTKAEVTKLLKEYKQGVRIDLGCGANKQEGFLGIDIRKAKGVDIVHDLEKYPWPLPDGCASLIMCSHLIEHIDPAKGGFLKFMDECWRILGKAGKLMISTPYAGSTGYFQDPTHVNPCNEVTWAYFDPLVAEGGLWRIYSPKPWKILANTYNGVGNMEVGLEKRLVDRSYDGGTNGKNA